MVANNKNQQFAVFCGLPRTGSTLLINLLMQNPNIHGEGASLLCELMWQTQQLCDNHPPLFANNKQGTKKDIMSALPSLYYKDIEKPIIIEKGRTWCHPANVQMWRDNINPDQKFVVLVRPIEDVVKSLVSLRIKNDHQGDLYEDLMQPGAEPIYRAAEAIALCKTQPQENFLYVDYRDLVSDPIKVLDLIYDFYGWDKFQHNVEKVDQVFAEDDNYHGLDGMHKIRETISVEKVNVDLPPKVAEFCEELNKIVYDKQIDGEWAFGHS
jgi:sulfotransferase